MLSLFTEKRFSHSLLTIAAALLAVTLGASPVLAKNRGGHMNLENYDHGHDHASDVYTSPGLKITTASQVAGLPSGEGALLEGHIVGQVGPGQYLFQDSTGMSTVLMSRSDWNSLRSNASGLVEIHGKITHGELGAAVEVERIAAIPN